MNGLIRASARALSVFALAALVSASGAPALAASPVTPALASILVHDPDVSTCYDQVKNTTPVAYIAKNFDVTNLALASGAHMVVVYGGGGCVCGNANCKVEVLHQNGDAYEPVLNTYAVEKQITADGVAILTSHDSANVSYRTTYAWNGSKYAVTNDELELDDPHTLKPAERTVKFAAGASSATLTGSLVQAGYEDHFAFDASAGQTVTLTLGAHDKHFGSFALLAADDAQLKTAATGSFSLKLPKSGTYHVVVDGADQTFTKYSVTLAIQ